MFKFKSAVTVVILFFVVGCSAPNANLVFIGMASDNLTKVYTDVYMKIITSKNLTKDEIIQFKLLDVKARYLIKEFRALKASGNVSTKDLYGIYKRAKVIYLSFRTALSNRYSEFPKEVQEVLMIFDVEATNLDRMVTSASGSEKKRKEALMEVQYFFISVLKIVIPLLLVT